MKVITIINIHSGSGQTTVTVNLATGLQARGHRVLILDWWKTEKLNQWLGNALSSGNQDNRPPTSLISPTRLGVDLWRLDCDEGVPEGGGAPASLMEGADYEYVLIHPTSSDHVKQLLDLPFKLAVCTDLGHPDQLGQIQALQQSLAGAGDEPRPVDLIISNKINTKEWDHNSQQLFALGDYYGYGILADPIPYCERIHDLPLTRRTVWELQQENLRSAFTRLVETVEDL
ncbi:MAG: AAA family ATPase [Syntrophomonadaceae bacterium]|nr:AAA family ATPase [Syntrophomonadaceae bacterium]